MPPTDEERKQVTMGRRLVSARALVGLKQSEVAERAGFSQSYLSQLENDAAIAPPLNHVAKLAELYGVSIDYLVLGDAERLGNLDATAISSTTASAA